MNSIRPVITLLQLAYLRAALRQIDPMHPDVPDIVVRIRDLEKPQ